MNFMKMHGCGNDFVMCHGMSDEFVERIRFAAPRLCDRRTGIGADGVIVVLPSVTADFRMRIFNADGSEAEMCGNGIRCFAEYLHAYSLTDKKILTIETLRGPIGVSWTGALIRVAMGAPILAPEMIPMIHEGPGPVVAEPLSAGGRTFAVTAVSMGNPHAVIFSDDLSDDLVLGAGRLLESHPSFPRHVNVEFVSVLSPTETRMRVYERGVGETAACGTGACASAVAGILDKRHGNTVTVHLNGGDLLVEWDGHFDHQVYMTGPATKVFRGTIEL